VQRSGESRVCVLGWWMGDPISQDQNDSAVGSMMYSPPHCNEVEHDGDEAGAVRSVISNSELSEWTVASEMRENVEHMLSVSQFSERRRCSVCPRSITSSSVILQGTTKTPRCSAQLK
jgi:hypothetical protein